MKIQIDKQVIEQALEAMQRGPWTLETKDKYNDAITALRSALESAESVEQEPDETKITMIVGAICKHLTTPTYPREVAAAAQYIFHRYCTHPAPAAPEVEQLRNELSAYKAKAVIADMPLSQLEAKYREALEMARVALENCDDPVWEVREAARKALAKIEEVLNK